MRHRKRVRDERSRCKDQPTNNIQQCSQVTDRH
jgi:hypothetical protein